MAAGNFAKPVPPGADDPPEIRLTLTLSRDVFLLHWFIMRVLVYDCSAGISGDMNLGALIDLGADREILERELSKLHVHGEWKLECRQAQQSGIQGTRVDVLTPEEAHAAHGHAHHHRTMADIRRLIETSGLSDTVKRTALSIFSLLAEAEARVHGTTPEEVHFHEVGAVDSIIDITGAAICLEMLRVDTIFTGPVELGSGTVTCQHGTMPVPAPATALLARHFQATLNGTSHEATTPTGAAYVAAMAQPVPSPLAGRITGTGYGIGHRQGLPLPNILRVMLVETEEEAPSPELLTELCANIDDMTPEQTAYLAEKLMEAGALDAWQESICMKKGRLAAKVCALCLPEQADGVREAFFLHSSTPGIRQHDTCRHILRRESTPVCTPHGTVHVKTSFMNGRPHHRKAEFEDCRTLAETTGLPLEQCQLMGLFPTPSHDDAPSDSV